MDISEDVSEAWVCSFEKCVDVEFCLRAIIGEKGFGVWLCAWPLCVETSRRCSQVSMRLGAHKFAAHAASLILFQNNVPLSLPLIKPQFHVHFSDLLIRKPLQFAHLCLSLHCLCTHANTRCTRVAAVSPFCVETVIGDLRVFPWVSGRVRPYLY